MVNSLVKKLIQEKAGWIRKLFGKRCLFCESALEEEEEEWEDLFPPLPICEICYNKYDFIKRLEEEKRERGEEARTKQFIELVSNFFANKCFFCEKNYKPSQEEAKAITFFPLCQSSCSPRYEIIAEWEKSLSRR